MMQTMPPQLPMQLLWNDALHLSLDDVDGGLARDRRS